ERRDLGRRGRGIEPARRDGDVPGHDGAAPGFRSRQRGQQQTHDHHHKRTPPPQRSHGAPPRDDRLCRPSNTRIAFATGGVNRDETTAPRPLSITGFSPPSSPANRTAAPPAHAGNEASDRTVAALYRFVVLPCRRALHPDTSAKVD